jgi:hypothetical protein
MVDVRLRLQQPGHLASVASGRSLQQRWSHDLSDTKPSVCRGHRRRLCRLRQRVQLGRLEVLRAPAQCRSGTEGRTFLLLRAPAAERTRLGGVTRGGAASASSCSSSSGAGSGPGSAGASAVRSTAASAPASRRRRADLRALRVAARTRLDGGGASASASGPASSPVPSSGEAGLRGLARSAECFLLAPLLTGRADAGVGSSAPLAS